MGIIFIYVLGSAESECNSGSECKSHMKRLKEDLFRDYDTSVRPVRLHSDRTTVIIEMIPLALVLVSFRLLIDIFLVVNQTQ